MQEDIESRTVNLAISTTKLTARTVISAAQMYLKHRKEVKTQKAQEKPTGKQTVKELIGQGDGVTNIDISKTDLKGFESVARKYGIDYAIRKDASVHPPKYLVFFKAKDTDAMTAAFNEYSASWPYFKDYRTRSYLYGRQFEGLEALEKQALQYIRDNGPVSSSSLPVEGSIFWHSSIHWSGNWHKESNAARSVLEQMYTDGRLVVHHKEGSRKYYDLSERYIPENILDAENPCPDDMSHIQWRILNRIGAVGLLWNRRSDAFLGIPMDAAQRNQAFEELERTGRIIPVTIAGIKTLFFIRNEDVSLMEEAICGEADYKSRCEFLAPLDPFLWDRKLIHALFNYQYSWEIYTPAEKRKYGYYVLPIVYGTRFVGRIEAIRDSKESVLRINHIWFEDGVRRTKKLESAIKKAAMRLARFNECKEIIMPE